MNAAEAERIARDLIAASARLRSLDGDDWPEDLAVPRLYGARDEEREFPKGCWVIHVEGDGLRVGCSRFIVIRKADGRVLADGNAGE